VGSGGGQERFGWVPEDVVYGGVEERQQTRGWEDRQKPNSAEAFSLEKQSSGLANTTWRKKERRVAVQVRALTLRSGPRAEAGT